MPVAVEASHRPALERPYRRPPRPRRPEHHRRSPGLPEFDRHLQARPSPVTRGPSSFQRDPSSPRDTANHSAPSRPTGRDPSATVWHRTPARHPGSSGSARRAQGSAGQRRAIPPDWRSPKVRPGSDGRARRFPHGSMRPADRSVVGTSLAMEVEQLGSSTSPRSIDSACPCRVRRPTRHQACRPRDPQRPWVVQGASGLASIVQAARASAEGRAGASRHSPGTWYAHHRVRSESSPAGRFFHPPARASKRMIRSLPTSNRSASGPSQADDHERAIGQFLDHSTYASNGMYGSLTGRPTGLPAASHPSNRTGPRVQFRERHPGHELGLGCAPCAMRTARDGTADLLGRARVGRPIRLPQRGALFVVQQGWLAPRDPRPNTHRSSMSAQTCHREGHGASSNGGTNEGCHTACSTPRGSTDALLDFGDTARRRAPWPEHPRSASISHWRRRRSIGDNPKRCDCCGSQP